MWVDDLLSKEPVRREGNNLIFDDRNRGPVRLRLLVCGTAQADTAQEIARMRPTVLIAAGTAGKVAADWARCSNVPVEKYRGGLARWWKGDNDPNVVLCFEPLDDQAKEIADRESRKLGSQVLHVNPPPTIANSRGPVVHSVS